ncbi:MAG: insulinase family protein, partial [Gemmatimonadetes bacterium]|nr:insulinase family protein [Gemmatimonadota bacterium]
ETVERLFGWIPRGEQVERPSLAVPAIEASRHMTLHDRVSLPQYNAVWRTPEAYSPDDAALGALAQILAGGKNSRLYRRLIYEEQIAQDVSAFNWSKLVAGDFFVRITAREGIELDRVESAVLEEISRLALAAPSEEELERVRNSTETEFVRALERVAGKADRLNEYLYYTGDAGYAQQDLQRFRSLTPADIQRVARDYLHNQNRVTISIVPEGQDALAATGKDLTR